MRVSHSACLIVNPVAGHGTGRRLGPRIRRYLAAGGMRCVSRFSRQPGDVAAQVERACAEGRDPLIVAGGDGTLHEAVNGLLRSRSSARLGVIPLGTGNDFVKTAGIPAAWRPACDRVLAFEPRTIDLGRCNDAYFLNGIGVGFDARVALAAREVPFLRGQWVYAAALLRTWASGVAAPVVTLIDDHGEIRQPVTLIAIANGQYYGSAFHIAPEARLDDGWLDVVIADAVSRLGVIRFAPRVVRGTHLNLPVVKHHQARRVVIRSEAGLPVQADGEILYREAHELEIEILPARLHLLA